MRELESYIAELDRRLWLVSGRIRRDIIAEARTHLVESASEHGGGRRGTARAIKEFGTPSDLAIRYTEVYEPGPGIHLVFASVAAVLGALSHPFLGTASALYFVILVVFLMYTGLVLGKRAGAISSLAAIAARFAVHGYLFGIYSDYVEAGAADTGMFVAGTLLLLIVGYIPGRLKERFFRENLL